MENIIIKLAKAHQNQLKDLEVKKEIENVQKYINSSDLKISENTLGLMCLKGFYDNFSKRTNTIMVFVNKFDKKIKELHGVVRIKVDSKDIQFANATFDFDEPFMGELGPNEGLLIHVGIPTRGLSDDRIFNTTELNVEFTDVRVTYLDENIEQ